MPFKSEKQRRYLWAKHPDIAKRWAKKYPNQKDLPMYKKDEKKASLAALSGAIVKFSPPAHKKSIDKNQAKKADSHLAEVELPKSDKPTSAGEETSKLEQKPEEKVLSNEDKLRNSPVVNTNPEMKKLSVVLSQAVRQAMSTGGQYTPHNVGLPNRLTPPAPVNPPPVGAQPAQQRPQQAQPQNPAAYQGALGGPGAMSPSSNPINNYGPLSASGDINGNAAFGVKNSPDSNKSAMHIDSNGKIHFTPQDALMGAGIGAAGAIPAAMYVYYQQKNKKKKPAETPDSNKSASSPAWQRSEGQNSEGGLNAKGRASYNKATGGNLKAPVTESNPSGDRAKRQNSFCARMCGMKSKETGAKTKADPDSRINKALSKWNCKCGSAYEFGQMLSGKSAASICSILDNKDTRSEGKQVENVKPTFQETENKADLNPNDATNKKQEQKSALDIYYKAARQN